MVTVQRCFLGDNALGGQVCNLPITGRWGCLNLTIGEQDIFTVGRLG